MQHAQSFPATTEQAGYFLDTGQIIHTSMVRAADKRYPNRRVRFGEPIDPDPNTHHVPSANQADIAIETPTAVDVDGSASSPIPPPVEFSE
eukprot:scaffold83161_cov29-Attheya_sp.AAC.1